MESIKIIIEGHATISTSTSNNKTEIIISLNSLSGRGGVGGCGEPSSMPVNYYAGDR